MNIHIKINTDNAAFDDHQLGPEVARILGKLAARFAEGDSRQHLLLDINGNRVGQVTYSSTLTPANRR